MSAERSGLPPRGLWLALRFLTRLPTPDPGLADSERIAASLIWYPVVGALLGGLLAAVMWLMGALGADPLLGAGVVVLVWVGLTGALHLDGLADMADAWVGGQGDPERTLAILKDMAIGPVGAAVVAAVLLLKLVAIAGVTPGALVAAVVIGRLVPAFLFFTTPYVRSGGLGVATSTAARAPTLTVMAVAVVAVIALQPVPGLVALVVAAATFFLLRGWMVRRIGGTTGDTIGATVEMVEATTLVALSLALA
ncbi:MAG: adenosylcobinamide-GDP ribazoletransferase [Pseudomonadota bacterium]